MHEFLVFTISGLTTASIYAITASGLTLTYVTTGVFNVAHGATGMVAAFAYWQVRFAWGWPAPLALLVCVGLLAPLLGVALERLVMRRLDGAAPAAQLVVTAALLVVLVSTAQWIWSPSDFRTMRELFAGDRTVVGGIAVPYNDIVVMVTAAAVAVGLWLLLHRTRIGVAMRAVVDDRTLATLNGARPQVVASVAWAIGTALAALAGILVAPKLTLSAIPLTLLIVNAYAAAVIGRLHSLPLTFAGALVVGLATDYGVGYVPELNTGGEYLQGFVGVIPVVVLVAALLALRATQPRGRPTLRTREIASTPTWGGSLLLVAMTLLGATVAATTLSERDLFSSEGMWGLGIIALSVIPLVGYAGQTSLCQLSFAGIGAVVVAHAGAGGNPFSLLLAALVAGVVGALVSLPALRLSGIYLALLTAGFAVTLDNWIFQLPVFAVFGHRFDLFESGSLSLTRFRIFDNSGAVGYFLFGAVMFVLVALGVVAVRRGDLGQRLVALKESPTACATLGMNLRTTTLTVFALSAAIAGLGGGIYAAGLQTATTETFSFFTGLSLLLVVVVAGVGSIGSGLAAALFLGSSLAGSSSARLTATVVGVAAVTVAANPNGLIPTYLRPAFAPVFRRPAVAIAGLGAFGLLWILRLVNVVHGSALAAGTVLLAAAVPTAAWALTARLARHRPARGLGGAPAPGRRAPAAGRDPDGLSAPLEWLGLASPFTPGDVALIERQLALSGPGPGTG